MAEVEVLLAPRPEVDLVALRVLPLHLPMLLALSFLVIQLSTEVSQTEVELIVNILQVCCSEQVVTGH